MKYILLFSIISLCAACGPNQTSTTTPTTDMPSVDMSEDLNDTDDACQPQTECPPNTCGMIDDGCGGQLNCGQPKTCDEINVCGMHDDGCGNQIDCGPCLCDGDQPTTSSCDACNIFALQCQSSQPVCDGPNIPSLRQISVTECEQRLIYVNANHQGDEQGTKTNPYKTVTAALTAIATKSPKPLAILIAGNQTYEGTINVTPGVHLLGGFNTDWQPDATIRPTLNGTPKTDDHVIGLQATNIAEDTWIAHLNITTPDAQNGHNNYAVHVNNSPKLKFFKVKAQAGKGGAGVHGLDGQDGADGVIGGMGRHGVGV